MKNSNINYKSTKLNYLLLTTASGHFQCEDAEQQDNDNTIVPIRIDAIKMNQIKIESGAYTVDRILILPFKKIDEAKSTNEDSNLLPDYTAAKHYGINYISTYAGAISTLPYFRPNKISVLNLKTTLSRLVRWLNLQVNNIPTYVISITFVAQKLVKAVLSITRTVTFWQATGSWCAVTAC